MSAPRSPLKTVNISRRHTARRSQPCLVSPRDGSCARSIYFGGDDSQPAAYVEVNVFGSSVLKSAWEKLTHAIMAALNSELEIPEDRIYIRYTATTDWGWNGGNF